MASTAKAYSLAVRRMCDSWLIEPAATPIASTGGALSGWGTTTSGSVATDQGHR
ncbi:MAG TPA: hypothetical protein VNT03_05740 [Baekduia sp.]|nr:hypothetical protein [Baekduia sp.]